MTIQTFLSNSYQTEIKTSIDSVDLINGCTAISLEENIFHPAGGGQPNDWGQVIINNECYLIKDLVKKKGTTIVILNCEIPSSEELWGQELKCILDWKRRHKLMRLHTGGHVLMSAARQTISGYEPKGMEIQDNLSYCEIAFSAEEAIIEAQANQMLIIAQEAINNNLNVDIKQFKNIEVAKKETGTIFRIDSNLKLSGKVRVIIIENFDANPCSGTHVRSLAEIGIIQLQFIDYNLESQEALVRFSLNQE